ncbi:MAG: hypothetical protein ABW162_11705 [Candidatus Sedimenticola sp. PURPLELP]
MDTARTENTCTRCRHLVLTGVACDWQPETCPYAQASHQAANNSQHSHSRVLAAAGEYDAIKSNN